MFVKQLIMDYEQEELLIDILGEHAERRLKDALHFESKGEYGAFAYHRDKYNKIVDIINQLEG